MSDVVLTRDHHTLKVSLPDEWIIIDHERLTHTGQLLGDTGMSLALGQIDDLLDDDDEPDLVASLCLPVHDPDGKPIGLVMSSLVGVCLPGEQCPAPENPMFAPSLTEDLELATGVTASFQTLTIPVWSEDRSVVALLSFASPNLPLADLLIAGWRNIAASARVASTSLPG